MTVERPESLRGIVAKDRRADGVDGGGFQETRKDMERAIRRLNALEYVILAAAVVVALAGGGLVAFLISVGTDLPLRPTWAVLSLLLIIVPAVAVFGREYRSGKKHDGTKGEDSRKDLKDGD